MIPISIHDRSHLTKEADSRAAFARTIDRAQRAEVLGYHRFWTAEHHGVPGVAGSSPAVLLAAIGNATSRIRIGAGGVMIPNHQPLVIAEQFATLEALFPGRIDLGIGRSLGFVRTVREALRRDSYSIDDLSNDLVELTTFLQGSSPVTLMPRTDLIPVFVLATGNGVETAGRLGLPLVIGGPNTMKADADGSTPIDHYRKVFRPSAFATDPHVILNLTAIAAGSAEQAEDLALSEAWAHVNSKTAGAFLPLESPEAIREKQMTERQRDRLTSIASGTISGMPNDVVTRIGDLIAKTGADEVLLSGCVFDHTAALRSDELLSNAFGLLHGRIERSTLAS